MTEGLSQSSMAWGDYNNDGFLDIIINGHNSNGIVTKLYKNKGDNSFSEESSIITGAYNGSVEWGDYNNDDLLDVLVTGELSRIYRNNGDNTFYELPGLNLPVVSGGNGTWGDYDNDGDLDILITGSGITKVYENQGHDLFSEQTEIFLEGLWDSQVKWSDYDNDGDLDIVLHGTQGTMPYVLKFYRNEGNNYFNEIHKYFPLGFAGALAINDLDNDHDSDYIIADGNAITIFKNFGNSFYKDTIILNNDFYNRIAISGDYDNDGFLDLIIGGELKFFPSNPVIKLYHNNGNLSFTEVTNSGLPGLNYGSGSQGDFDNDGDLDLVLVSEANVKIFRNDCPAANQIPGKPENLAYKHIGNTAHLTWDRDSKKSLTYNLKITNNSGKINLIPSHSGIEGNRKIVSIGNAQINSTFFLKLRWDTNYVARVQALNNSYKGGPFSDEITFKIDPIQPSELTASYTNVFSLLLKWKRGNGDRCIVFAKEGTSGTAAPQNSTTYYSNPVFGEGSSIGNSGWFCIYKGTLDSVLISGLMPKKSYVLHAIEFEGIKGSERYAPEISSDNYGAFSTGLLSDQSSIVLPGETYGEVEWIDYNNDKFLDLFISGTNPKLFRNNGNNTFSEQNNIRFPNYYGSSIDWGDYDNDGWLDLLISGAISGTNNCYTKLYRNLGNSGFSEMDAIMLTNVYSGDVAWADFDNDDDLDIIVTGASQVIDLQPAIPITQIFENKRNGIFENVNVSLRGVIGGSVNNGDYDNDGDIDILLTGQDASGNEILLLYRNNGSFSFTELNVPSIPIVYHGSISSIDFDNDGWLDIFVTGSETINYPYNPVSKLLRNNRDNSFAEVTNTSFLGISRGTSEWGDFNNDGLLDFLIAGELNFRESISRIYQNNGDGTFSELKEISLANLSSSSASWGDYDNDGDLDLLFGGLVGGFGGAVTKIYRNNSLMRAGNFKSNSKPLAPFSISHDVAPGIVSLIWGNAADSETDSKTMSYNLRYKQINEDKWRMGSNSLLDGTRTIPSIGNIQLNTKFSLKSLKSGVYCWQVQGVDQSYLGGVWSDIDTFQIKTTQAFFYADDVCKGNVTKFINQTQSDHPIVSWKWDFGDGSSSLEQNPSHTYSNSGNYNVKLVVSSSEYSDSLVKTITVLPKADAVFSADPVCHGTSTVFQNTSSLNGLAITSWEWDLGDKQTSNIQSPPEHFYAQPGSYTVKLKVTAENGCADTISKKIIVGEYPVVILSANGPLEFCSGSNVKLSVAKKDSYLYQWKLADVPLTDSTGSRLTVLNTGEYSVTVNNSVANCISHSPKVGVTVTEKPAKPSIQNAGDVSGICEGTGQVELAVRQASSSYNYQWKRDGVPIDNASGPVLTRVLYPGNYSVSANIKGCSVDSDPVTMNFIEALPKPILYVQGPVVWYMASSNDTAANYKWYLNNELIQGADRYIYMANKTFGTYKVAIANREGCITMSDEVTIPVTKGGMTNFNIPSDFLKAENIDPFTNLKIYPNPTPGLFTIEMDNNIFGELSIDIFAQAGNKILNIKFKKTTEHFMSQVDLSGQPRGMYLINLVLDKFFATRKLLVE